MTHEREGATEQIIGRCFAQGGGRREKVVLAARVYGDRGKGDRGKGDMTDWPNTPHFSALHIHKISEDSLRRLQTDYIDL